MSYAALAKTNTQHKNPQKIRSLRSPKPLGRSLRSPFRTENSLVALVRTKNVLAAMPAAGVRKKHIGVGRYLLNFTKNVLRGARKNQHPAQKSPKIRSLRSPKPLGRSLRAPFRTENSLAALVRTKNVLAAMPAAGVHKKLYGE
jgi:hypothetical protein